MKVPKESKARYRNITVEVDLLPKLHEITNNLESRFGFRPTLSQTMRYLIANFEGGRGERGTG